MEQRVDRKCPSLYFDDLESFQKLYPESFFKKDFAPICENRRRWQKNVHKQRRTSEVLLWKHLKWQTDWKTSSKWNSSFAKVE